MGDQRYEIDVQRDCFEWGRVPRRCANIEEATQVAIAFLEMYVPLVKETIAVRFRKVP